MKEKVLSRHCNNSDGRQPGIPRAMTFLGKYPGVEDFGSFRYDDPATIINGEFDCVVKRN